MTKLRNLFTAALAVATLGVVALETSPASARWGGHHGFHHHWGHHYHWHHHYHWSHHYHWRYHYHWRHSWGGYRSTYVIGGAAPRVCPIGTHLGYQGKYCWPNR